jgi:hypothetical protein
VHYTAASELFQGKRDDLVETEIDRAAAALVTPGAIATRSMAYGQADKQIASQSGDRAPPAAAEGGFSA